MPIQDYSTDPDLNVQISGINIAEGCPPSGINNAIRQLMADVKVESEAQAEAITAAGEALEAFAEERAAKDDAQDEAIAGKLNKSGGTMTGFLKFDGNEMIRRTGTTDYLRIYGGDGYGSGAYLDVCGKDYEGNPAGFQLVVSNGTAYRALRANIDDGLMWTGKKILNSDGGNITGPFKVASGINAITSQTDTSYFRILGGTSPSTGANLDLYGGNGEGEGKFILRARNSSGYKALEGKINGSLTWDNKPIITLVASWRSGANWYRKYSDGWIEQGGNEETGNKTITLHTPFTDTNYQVVNVGFAISGSGQQYITNKTTTSFTTSSNVKESWTASWYACGY